MAVAPPPLSTGPTTREFRILWSAVSAGGLALWMLKFALPLAALAMTRSPAGVAFFAAASRAPGLVFGLAAGIVADRSNRRAALAGALFLVGASGLALLVALATASLIALVVAAVLVGSAETLTDPLTTAMVPAVSSPSRLERDNRRILTGGLVIEAVALPLAGVLALIGLSLTVSAAAAVAAGAAALAWHLDRRQFEVPRTAQTRVSTHVTAGLRFIWGVPVLRTITFIGLVINGCWSAWLAVFVVFAVAPGRVGLTEFGYGILLSAGAIGGLVGLGLAGPVTRRIGRRWLIGLNIVSNGILFGSPLLTDSPAVLAGALLLGGIGGPMWASLAMSLVQALTPVELRGRAATAYRLPSLAALAVGPLLIGPVARSAGLATSFGICCGLTFALLVPFTLVLRESAIETAFGLDSELPSLVQSTSG